MDSQIRRRSLRTWSLTIRMVALTIGVPLFVIAALGAVVVFIAHGAIVLCVLAVVLAVTLWRGVAGIRDPGIRGSAAAAADEPGLVAIVERQCALIDIAAPEVLLSPSAQPNSWVIHAPGSRPRLYVTRALLALLSPDELQAVIAHELTHIANRDALLMTVVSAPGAALLRVRGGGLWWPLLTAIGVVASLGSSMLSRCRELAADAGSATITGRPSALSSALMKVSESRSVIPERDLRAAAQLNAFNLVAVAPASPRWYHDLGHVTAAFATHPRLDARMRHLAELERRRQQPRR